MYPHFLFPIQAHTQTHTQRKISTGHCKPRRHRRWGPFWLAKTERNVLRPRRWAVDRSFPRQLPQPPSTSETKMLPLPLGVSSLLHAHPLPPPPPPPLAPQASILPRHSSASLFFPSIWPSPLLLSCLLEQTSAICMCGGGGVASKVRGHSESNLAAMERKQLGRGPTSWPGSLVRMPEAGAN